MSLQQPPRGTMQAKNSAPYEVHQKTAPWGRMMTPKMMARMELNSIGHDATHIFAIGFPSLQHSLPFWVFASLVVHVCQRLVEHTSFSIDTPSRRISASHASHCIGCIVWALDLVGLLMYDEFSHQALGLAPTLGGLLIMVVSAHFTIPTLSTSASKARITVAGMCLASGMLAAHFAMTQAYVVSFMAVNGLAIVLAIALATGISAYTSIRHRSSRLNARTSALGAQSLEDKVLCGGAVLVLHWLLVNTFTLHSPDVHTAPDNMALLIIVPAFAFAVALEQMGNMRRDAGRQQLVRRGLAMMRASGMAHNANHDRELSLIADHLPKLLHPEKLTLHFQPILDFESHGARFEALLRINDKTLGNIHPETFFLACELQCKTVQVDQMILCNALDAIKAWQTEGLDDFTINVNVAPVTLIDDAFTPWLKAQLDKRAIPSKMLKLEITEHAVIALGADMLAALQRLDAIGVAVLMDDFGAGYSSLGMLADLPIAGIKCDRLFVRQLLQDHRRQVLLRHISGLAHELGLSVVVEGVETADELRTLDSLGLHCIQGYLFSIPLRASEVPDWCHTKLQPQREALQALLHTPASDASALRPCTSSAPTPVTSHPEP